MNEDRRERRQTKQEERERRWAAGHEMQQRKAPPLRSPLEVDPGAISDHELAYQTWRCVYTIRTILVWWVVLSVIGVVAIVLTQQ